VLVALILIATRLVTGAILASFLLSLRATIAEGWGGGSRRRSDPNFARDALRLVGWSWLMQRRRCSAGW